MDFTHSYTFTHLRMSKAGYLYWLRYWTCAYIMMKVGMFVIFAVRIIT